jgi:hypothetical protein
VGAPGKKLIGGKMDFSINYSQEAAELLREGSIRIDRFKCADWPDMIADASKLAATYVHFPFDIGTPSGRAADLAKASEMAQQTQTPFINFHVVSYDRDFPGPRDRNDEAIRLAVIEKALADTRAAAAALGADRVIIENIPWFGAGGEFHQPSVDPEVMHHVIRETGVGFLLDLSHARISAHYLGVDAREYISSLPVHALRELHVTGIKMHKTRLADHMELADQDWQFAQWAIDRIRAGDWGKPWMLAFEYGGIGAPFKWRSRAEVIREQTPRLYELAHSIA